MLRFCSTIPNWFLCIISITIDCSKLRPREPYSIARGTYLRVQLGYIPDPPSSTVQRSIFTHPSYTHVNTAASKMLMMRVQLLSLFLTMSHVPTHSDGSSRKVYSTLQHLQPCEFVRQSKDRTNANNAKPLQLHRSQHHRFLSLCPLER